MMERIRRGRNHGEYTRREKQRKRSQRQCEEDEEEGDEVKTRSAVLCN
jgi:hypothetical protein